MFLISLLLFIVILLDLYLTVKIKKLDNEYRENFKSILQNHIDIKTLFKMFKEQTKINDLFTQTIETKKELKKCNCWEQGEQTDDKKERY